jgi:hypothetical protein
MGYNTRIEGEITISPPLTFAEIEASGLDIRDPWSSESNVRLRVDSREVKTDRGILTEKTAAALIPAMEDPFKAYRIVEDVQAFAAAFAGTHDLAGYFECVGDDDGDIWRLEVNGGRVRRIRAAILWPEDVADLRTAVQAERSQWEATLCPTCAAARALLHSLDDRFERAERF